MEAKVQSPPQSLLQNGGPCHPCSACSTAPATLLYRQVKTWRAALQNEGAGEFPSAALAPCVAARPQEPASNASQADAARGMAANTPRPHGPRSTPSSCSSRTSSSSLAPSSLASAAATQHRISSIHVPVIQPEYTQPGTSPAMPCRGRCFSSINGSRGKPIVHEEPGQLGLTWYFCPAHRQFHAVFLSEGTAQPLCGECAVLFFDRTYHGLWVRQLDLNAVMSNSQEIIDNALADFNALILEIDEARFAEQQEATSGPLLPSEDLPPDLLAEIPKGDSTYVGLSTTLIPHKRIAGLSLLEYRTFHGAMAYQPCSRTIDARGIFDSLRPIDQNGDPVFKQARIWCCIVQARPELPKELRWVLATMYNFCCEMLRPENDEDTLWRMRKWLMHWYNVADQLLDSYSILESGPDIDWFARPISSAPDNEAATSWPSGESEARELIRQCVSDSSSGNGTVIRHRPDWAGSGPWTSHGLVGDRVATIHAWLAQQSHPLDIDETSIFDPTPSGYVSPRTRRAMLGSSLTTASRNGGPVSLWSRLDPRAAVFTPRAGQNLPPSLTEKETIQESDESLATDEDDDRDTEMSACSCPLSSNCRMAPYAGYGARAPRIELGEVAAWSLNAGAS